MSKFEQFNNFSKNYWIFKKKSQNSVDTNIFEIFLRMHYKLSKIFFYLKIFFSQNLSKCASMCSCFNPISYGYRPSLALTGGGADSAPCSNWMKEGTETQLCYLEVGHLSKWRSHAKIWAPISKFERDFKIFRKSQLSWKKIVFGQKRLPFSQFLIFFVLVFCKQSHFHSV